jgi:hypothetical protein
MGIGHRKLNRTTRISVSLIGIFFGIAGLDHGFFESLQGNRVTPGLFIQAIGPAQRMWLYGTEDAFTIIPNFLVTGILAVLVSIAIMIWAVGFVQLKNGPLIFILLFVLLFLVGGGVGQVVFFIPTWAAATRINKPLTWWRKILSERVSSSLSKFWRGSLIIGSICFLVALEIAIFGYFPGLENPERIQVVCWSFLASSLVVFLFTFVAGFAHDIQA